MIRSIKVLSLFILAVLTQTMSYAQAPTKPAAPAAAPASTENPNWAKTDGMYAVFTTAKGKIVCALEYKKIPMTVGNFVSLCEGTNPKSKISQGKPFYDGLKFHRVIPNFMIQGGDPMGSGMGDPGYKFPDEFDPTLRHTGPGILSMANAGPGTNGSQFFITHVATPWLNDKHTIFGRVVEGQSVVNAVVGGDTMHTVRVVRVGKAAKEFNAPKAFTTGEETLGKKQEEAIKEQRKKQEEAMKEMIKKHDEETKKAAAAYAAGWDAKVKAKFPTAKKTASGLYYIVDQEGTGAVAQPDQTVVVHYTGTFWDGSKFDSSMDRGQPIEFPLGQHNVIDGWDEGFGIFKVGTKGKLIIPYYLAYGEQGRNPIPPKTDLIFDVEMLGVK